MNYPTTQINELKCNCKGWQALFCSLLHFLHLEYSLTHSSRSVNICWLKEWSSRKKKNEGLPDTGASDDCCGLSRQRGFLRGDDISTDTGGSEEIISVNCLGRSHLDRQQWGAPEVEESLWSEHRQQPWAEVVQGRDKRGQRLVGGPGRRLRSVEFMQTAI